MKKTIIILIWTGLLFLLPSTLFAVETGKIQGKVVDENGTGLPGVEISAESINLQGKRTTLSSKTGEFLFSLLPVGTYTLTSRLEGFNPVVQKNVIVRLGMVTSLTIRMNLSEIQEEVVVTAEIPLIDKTSSNTSYRLSSKDLEKIPSQSRTVVDVVKFTPGAAGVRVNTKKGTATEGQPSFRGEGEEGNNWIVDGIPISGVRLRNAGLSLNFDSRVTRLAETFPRRDTDSLCASPFMDPLKLRWKTQKFHLSSTAVGLTFSSNSTSRKSAIGVLLRKGMRPSFITRTMPFRTSSRESARVETYFRAS